MIIFAIMVTLWIFVICIIRMLGEERRTKSLKPEPKENNLKSKLEYTKRRADKKRARKNS
jgi:beta-lactamase regulating signal transducer with metallopeptidase domain